MPSAAAMVVVVAAGAATAVAAAMAVAAGAAAMAVAAGVATMAVAVGAGAAGVGGWLAGCWPERRSPRRTIPTITAMATATPMADMAVATAVTPDMVIPTPVTAAATPATATATPPTGPAPVRGLTPPPAAL